MHLRHLPRPTSKPGLLILGGVLLLCFIGIALVFLQIRQPRTRLVLEAPTVVLSPTELASYPRPPIHPQARQTQVHLTTRPGCIDNCEGFEPLYGLGQRFSEFTVALPASEVLSFYQTTLLAQGWMRISSDAFNHDELKKTPGIEPP